jgi:thiol-disulfide isomerase/thioredoxin
MIFIGTLPAGMVAAEPDAAPGADPAHAAVMHDIMPHLAAAAAAMAEGKPVDITALDAVFRRFLADWPESADGWKLLTAYLRFATHGKIPRSESEVLATFLDSPNRSVREFAENQVRLAALRQEPLQLSFTALDGREVDVAKLRGKVVLIDFWATWCVPCIAELPNLKQVYADYHELGFEVIGVSLDQVRDRDKFRALVQRENLPWPQRFEGGGWEDTLARRFNVTEIPATFLFDQTGRLVASGVRGSGLGAEVKRLLKP